VSPQELDPAQVVVDEVVTEWPDVRAKQVFGHRGYVRAGRMFGFHASSGVAVKVFAGDDADEMYARPGVKPFVYNGTMEMRAWPVLPLRDDSEVEVALTALKRAYDRAI
jgi:hypothetical protein